MKTLFVLEDDQFFRNFAYFKKKYYLSRKALSRLLRVSIFMVEDMEKNRCNYDLPLAVISRASQVFGVDMDDLVAKDLSHTE